MANTITIQNKARRMLALNLAHEDHLKSINVRTTVVVADGRRYPKTVARRVPRDLTLTAAGTPGSIVSGLPESVLKCPDVANARRRGEIVVIERTVDSTAETTPTKRNKRGRK